MSTRPLPPPSFCHFYRGGGRSSCSRSRPTRPTGLQWSARMMPDETTPQRISHSRQVNKIWVIDKLLFGNFFFPNPSAVQNPKSAPDRGGPFVFGCFHLGLTQLHNACHIFFRALWHVDQSRLPDHEQRVGRGKPVYRRRQIRLERRQRRSQHQPDPRKPRSAASDVLFLLLVVVFFVAFR
jgi:hypothetical protein